MTQLICDYSGGLEGDHYTNDHILFTTNPCSFLQGSFPRSVDATFPPSKGAVQAGEKSSYAWPSHLGVFHELLAVPCGAANETIADIFKRLGYVEKVHFWSGQSSTSLDTLLLVHSSLAQQAFA